MADSSLAEDLDLVHRRSQARWRAPLTHARGETITPQALPDLSLEVDAIVP